MLSDNARKIRTGEYANLYAIPDMSIACNIWDGRLCETLKCLRENHIEFNQQGMNSSADKWPINFTMSDKAREVLEASKVKFSTGYHFPGLF